MNEEKTALISVYHKDGIVEFVQQLVGLGWSIIASGGTAKVLSEAGIRVTDVADLVGGGAILGHRVVTLSREIHAGLLSRDTDEDNAELERLNIPRIDLVCVDLYPLQDEIKNPNSTRESVIDKTDIGGPTMLRSAAKGRRIVICDPDDRQKVIERLKGLASPSGRVEPLSDDFISGLVAKAEAVVADYCLASARYHSGVYPEQGRRDGIVGEQTLLCKYGENAPQTPAGLYSIGSSDPFSLNNFKIVAGTSPSYNNVCDIDRLLQTATHIVAGFHVNRGKVPLIGVAVKHGNPCGAAVGDDAIEVLQNMVRGDTRAIFGGLVMVNFPIGEKEADVLLTYLMDEGQRRLLDGIIAPSFSDEAIEMLKRRGDKCRFIVNPALGGLDKDSLDIADRFRYVRGGFLRQPNYKFVLNFNDENFEKSNKTTRQQEDNLLLAWAIGSTSNSNTVTLVKDNYLIGNGVGQQDRVGACKLAISRANDAGHDTSGAVAYSDSFFPFVDAPEVLAENGVKAILSSSGSVRDEDVKNFCKEKGIVLYLIPDKLGRGFFGH